VGPPSGRLRSAGEMGWRSLRFIEGAKGRHVATPLHPWSIRRGLLAVMVLRHGASPSLGGPWPRGGQRAMVTGPGRPFGAPGPPPRRQAEPLPGRKPLHFFLVGPRRRRGGRRPRLGSRAPMVKRPAEGRPHRGREGFRNEGAARRRRRRPSRRLPGTPSPGTRSPSSVAHRNRAAKRGGLPGKFPGTAGQVRASS